jgi:hypothetical protein
MAGFDYDVLIIGSGFGDFTGAFGPRGATVIAGALPAERGAPA